MLGHQHLFLRIVKMKLLKCYHLYIARLIFIVKKNHGKREEDYFNAEQNALTAKDAELYYRTMIKGDVNSWNIRDTHMMETHERIIAFYGKDNPKGIVWAHNTHIGDARAIYMFKDNTINLGQLVSERKNSNNTVLVGFGTYKGSVNAAKKMGR